MGKYKYLTPLLIFMIFSSQLFAGPRIFTTFIYADGGETFEQLLSERYGVPDKVLNEEGYLKKLSRWNSGLSPNKKLASGQKLYIELPYHLKKQVMATKKMRRREPIAKKNKVKKPKREIASKENIIEVKDIEIENKPERSDFILTTFFTASQGKFSEELKGSNISASTTQDSPITLGLAATINKDEKWFYSTSFYISHLSTSASSTLGEAVDIPFEYGSNFYWNYRLKPGLAFYLGGDLERFSTFNIQELQSGSNLDTREHNIIYFTVGTSFSYSLLKKPVFTKLSFSQSLLSQSNVKSSDDDTLYSGNKSIIFKSIPLTKKWGVHVFFKQHLLNGPTELNISRYGAGVSYRLF